MHEKILPKSEGLLRCLQALAEETAALDLTQTHAALQQAIDICRAERGMPRSGTPATYIGLLH